ncbi:MAG: MaoC family dehydratase N-terminal domain-containing protein [Rhizobiaceae bacterium]|nr:MaoC family dehydratase N-terminal domain-containing protein [Rhizobiaceae bacterium]
MSGIDIDHLRRWIGREERQTDIITPALVERFEATLGEAACPSGVHAPLAIHWCLAPQARPTGELGPDGHPARGGFLPPVPLQRRMWAGGKVKFYEPLRIATEVTRISRIANVSLKSGRSGDLVFVAVDHEIVCDEKTAIAERQDIVYRAPEPTIPSHMGTLRARGDPCQTPAADHSETVEATTTLLFRYSALTFNGHRIHYDVEYARQEEGYPGLVVHGPLQATLMLHMASRIDGGLPPRSFSYRGVAPLFHGTEFTMNALRTAGGVDLWCADHAGRTTMTAQVVGARA